MAEVTFTLASDVYNRFISRLNNLLRTDEKSTVILTVEEDRVTARYKGAVDKGEISALYIEHLQHLSAVGDARKLAFLAKDLLMLKVPDLIEDTKYPHCKEVTFSLLDTQLTVSYEVYCSPTALPSFTSFTVPLLLEAEVSEDFKAFDSPKAYEFEITTQELRNAISVCNFFKADVTTRVSNGCLFRADKNGLKVLGTDSNVAALYFDSTLKWTVKEEFLSVLSASALKLIDKFITDTEYVSVGLRNSTIYVETGSRKMLTQILGKNSPLMDFEGLFDDLGNHVAEFHPGPVLSLLAPLLASSSDNHNKLKLELAGDDLNLRLGTNFVQGVPATVHKNVGRSLNGEYFYSVLSKVSQLSKDVWLYYHRDRNCWALTDADRKVTFLIQGLND